MSFGRWPVAAFLAVSAASAVLLGAGAGSTQPPSGGYTRAQAAAGQYVYVQYCLRCHGQNLQGGESLALARDRQFGRSMARGKMTTAALYTFIREANATQRAGHLSEKQYLSVLAYHLAEKRLRARHALRSPRRRSHS